MDRSPWSGKQLRRLGERLRDGGPPPSIGPDYDQVRLHYSGVAAEVQEQINALDWRHLLGHREFEVTSRAKTIDTVREKLQRDRATPLSHIQDIAGVRFEAEMSLTQQQAVAETIARRFSAEPGEVLHDLRSTPHSGYRAVHVWLRLPQRVEVQVRTHLQGAWANLYEEAADHFGRHIRYGRMPDDPDAARLVREFQRLALQNILELEVHRDELFLTELQNDDASRHRPISTFTANASPSSRGREDAQIEARFQTLRSSEQLVIDRLERFRDDLRRIARLEGGLS